MGARAGPGTAAGLGAPGALRDLGLVGLLALVVLGAGLGLRDPWPADEPRFALVASEMLAHGNWFVPTVGGDVYGDKPPVFFWAIAAFLALTGSLRLAFLLPPLLAGLGTLALVYDLARRLWGREAGQGAALLLLFTAQFTLQARLAQIDGFLLFWVVLGLYGIARHLLVGPDWRWYAAGGFACGIGVITKGVGFLPLLLPAVAALLGRAGFEWRSGRGGWRWALAPLAALGGIALWAVPMLVQVATTADPVLVAYRDEILFQQTVERYADAWHHHEPFWYFVVEVIPVLWLPAVALLPWLVPRWREAFRARDGAPWLLLGWVLVVLLFFSASSGKRGVYILPALPAFVLAAAPYLPALWRRAGVQRLGAVLAGLLGALLVAAAGYLTWLRPDRLAEIESRHGIGSLAPVWTVAAIALAALVAFGARRGALALATVLGSLWIVQGLWVNPQLDADRSGRAFMRAVEAAVPQGFELGLVGWREQFLLQSTRPSVNFGHARWREPEAESKDAARWLNAAPGRVLLVSERHLAPCFLGSPRRSVGYAGRREFLLVDAPAAEACAAAGDPRAARRWSPAPFARHRTADDW